MENDHIYIAIDMKSFYASVECVERQLDPMDTNLVVADASRTEKTICLAVSPSLKSFGISGRARLFEVVQKVREVNTLRKSNTPGHQFLGESYHAGELQEHPEFSLSYIIALPRMAYYMEYSTKIYEIYLRYIAPEDIHVYSIDEVFMDVTAYLKTYSLSAKELAAPDRRTSGIMGKYDDIINLPHHESTKHPKMPALDRAAQFQPFAALSGHDVAVRKTARLTNNRRELDVNQKEELDVNLQLLRDQLAQKPQASITYFVPDAKKRWRRLFHRN